MTGLRARIRELERAVEAVRRKPTLLLKTYDGETFGGPDGQTFTEDDLPRLHADYDVLVIQYVEDWRSPVRPGSGL